MRFTPSEMAKIKSLHGKDSKKWSQRDKKFLKGIQARLNAEAKEIKKHNEAIDKLGGVCNCCGEETRSMLTIKGDRLACRNCDVESGCPAASNHGWLKSYRAQAQAVIDSAQSAPLPIQPSYSGPVVDPNTKKAKIGKVTQITGDLAVRVKAARRMFRNAEYRYKLSDNLPHMAYEVAFWKQVRDKISCKKLMRFTYEELPRIFTARRSKALWGAKPMVDSLKEQILTGGRA